MRTERVTKSVIAFIYLNHFNFLNGTVYFLNGTRDNGGSSDAVHLKDRHSLLAGNNKTIRIKLFECWCGVWKLMPHSYNKRSYEVFPDWSVLHFDQSTTVQNTDDPESLDWLFEEPCDVEVTRFDVVSIKDVCENNSGDPLQCDLVRQNGDNDTIQLKFFTNDPSRKLTRSAKTEMDSMPHSYTADSRFELLGSFPSHWSLNFDECDAYQVEGDPKSLGWLFESDSEKQQAVHDAYKAAQNESALKARKASAFKNTLFAVSLFLSVTAIVMKYLL
jgi:hypothetical protein